MAIYGGRALFFCFSPIVEGLPLLNAFAPDLLLPLRLTRIDHVFVADHWRAISAWDGLSDDEPVAAGLDPINGSGRSPASRWGGIIARVLTAVADRETG